MPYIHFTEEQKLRAASVDLEEFLRFRGEGLMRSGRDKRLKSDHSVTVNGNEWYDHVTQKGGGPISFVQTFYGLSYPEPVTLLLGGETGEIIYPSAKEKVVEPPKPFELPPLCRSGPTAGYATPDARSCSGASRGEEILFSRIMKTRSLQLPPQAV